MRHPAVSLCAVVAKPDDKWGEVPCAFVELKEGAERHRSRPDRLCPHAAGGVHDAEEGGVPELPKTSTGKIQKFELRALAKTL